MVDQPSGGYAHFPRERQLCAIVRAAGGRVVLTGRGGDELFMGSMFFFADWIAAGRVWPALREMARRAAIGRASFWELAYKNSLIPLFPRSVHRYVVKEDGQVPPWVTSGVARKYGLRSRAIAPRRYGGRIGHKYSDAMAEIIDATPATLAVGVVEDNLDVRHPFFYRPLVEFALRLPPEVCVRPYARKWLLREAMRGILPEIVRTRVGKGILYGLLASSLVRQRAYLEPLLRDPILGELGIVDPAKLRAGFEGAQYEPYRTQKLFTDVQSTLAIEAWLQARCGRWPCRTHTERPSSAHQFNGPQ
jgi:asparagine synthase (glutamine-hydrolysing)